LNIGLLQFTCLKQDLKIEGEQTETNDDDNGVLMLQGKKKKQKKVDFEEGEPLVKDDGRN